MKPLFDRLFPEAEPPLKVYARVLNSGDAADNADVKDAREAIAALGLSPDEVKRHIDLLAQAQALLDPSAPLALWIAANYPWLFVAADGQPQMPAAPVGLDAPNVQGWRVPATPAVDPWRLYTSDQIGRVLDWGRRERAHPFCGAHVARLSGLWFGASILAWAREVRRIQRVSKLRELRGKVVWIGVDHAKGEGKPGHLEIFPGQLYSGTQVAQIAKLNNPRELGLMYTDQYTGDEVLQRLQDQRETNARLEQEIAALEHEEAEETGSSSTPTPATAAA